VEEKNQKKRPAPRPPKAIKRLAPGMQIEGTVKAVTDFGAFVDIGVGRDGLVHVSEISRQSVSKPGDVLREGDKVTVWIKELDRKRNRIGLTMIDPDTPSVEDLREGDVVRGRVARIERYGAFVDIGVEREALLHVREMGDEFVSRPQDVVHMGDEVEVRIIKVDVRRRRVDVTMKGVGEEEDEALAIPDEDEDEEEIPTIMQVAMEEALHRQQGASKPRKKKEEKAPAKRDELDDIIRRTLESHRDS